MILSEIGKGLKDVERTKQTTLDVLKTEEELLKEKWGDLYLSKKDINNLPYLTETEYLAIKESLK